MSDGLIRTGSHTIALETNSVNQLVLNTSIITSNLPFTAGSNSITGGTVNCTTLSQSTLYSLRLYLNTSQSPIVASTATYVVWDTIQSVGGGNSNFIYSPSSSVITIPVNGMYLVIFEGCWAATATGIKETWCEINSVTAGTGISYGFMQTAQSNAPLGQVSSFLYRFTAGDTVQAVVFAGGTTLTNFMLGKATNSTQFARFSIVQISN